MAVEYIRRSIDSEQVQAFEQAYRRAAAALDASEHLEAYELSRCSDDPAQHVVCIEWASEEGHLSGFETVGPFVHDIDEMRHYQVTFATRDDDHRGRPIRPRRFPIGLAAIRGDRHTPRGTYRPGSATPRFCLNMQANGLRAERGRVPPPYERVNSASLLRRARRCVSGAQPRVAAAPASFLPRTDPRRLASSRRSLDAYARPR
jgi:hypothetical protein